MLSFNNVSRIRDYTTNVKALTNDFSQLFQTFMTQIASFAFKVNDSSSVLDYIKIQKSRVTVQRSSLLFLLSAFDLLDITIIFCATVIRLNSCLNKNSITLAALVIILVFSKDFQR